MLFSFSVYNDLKFLIPELFLLINILFLLIFSSFYSNQNIYKYTRLIKPLVVLILVLISFYILLLLNNIDNSYIISSYLLISNNIILFIKIFLSIMLVLIILSSYNYLYLTKIFLFEFYIIIMLSFIGMILLVMSFDLIMIYLSIELQSLCFYILAAINRDQNRSIEAGLKYFVLGSFSSSILILGISILYGITGLTNLKDLNDLLSLTNDTLFLNFFFYLGLILINIGFFFKLSIAPFHIWLPDIFDGSIKVMVAIFSTLPKVSLIFIFYQFYNVILIHTLIDWQFFFIIFIILSWVIGILGALKANRINKLLAYSSINHIGFILLSLSINNIENILIYIFIYIIILINIFFILFCFIKRNNNVKINSINKFIYIYKNNIILSYFFTITIFSLAGIPPLAGFFGKFFLFLEVIKLNWYLIALIGLLLSIVSCFYYLRLIKNILFNNSNNWSFFYNIDKPISYMLSFGILFNIFFILILPFILEFFRFIAIGAL